MSPPNSFGQPDVAKRPARPRHRPSLAGLRVLVAEDVEMVRDLLTILLTREKVVLTTVIDGAQALAMAEVQDFDIILMDMNMPVMSGFEATRRIRLLEGPRANVPILALTANASKAEVAQCGRAGMDGHVAKPFTPAVLMDAIADLLFSEE
ncbi:response regulator [Asticcacaulis biprosthecium]|nr:response regulator [Asticcacaulis biprosthecium]